MARIRTIKPEFWTSEQIVECSPIARLMFIGMWNFCDDGGNHPASYKTLKMEVFPGDEISLLQIEDYANELLSNELIVQYDGGNGRQYWHVTGWDHQKIDRPNPKHPSYDKEKIVEQSTNEHREIIDQSPPEGKVREGKVKEETKEKILKKEIPEALPEQDLVSEDLWKEFLKLRTKLKAVNSPQAIKCLISELNKLKAQGNDPEEVIQQSIRSSWKDVYAIKKCRDSPAYQTRQQLAAVAARSIFGDGTNNEKCINGEVIGYESTAKQLGR